MQKQPRPETDLYERARDVAESAARRAAELIREAAGTIKPDQIREKGINDIVTAVDEEAQRAIVAVIAEDFPDHAILAEEDLDMRSAGADAPEFLWIIDPIDGTTNFTRGIPPFAVSIALAHQDALVVGVVLDVAHDVLYSAVSGRGLLVDGEPATVGSAETLAESVMATGFPYRAFGHVDLYLDVLKSFMRNSRAVRRPGAASVDLAWVACGRFDGFFETGLNPWDVAAGIVLVREGGGRVTDYRGHENPAFDRQIIASNGLIHEEILELVQPMKDIED